jgi:hypothetical protein
MWTSTSHSVSKDSAPNPLILFTASTLPISRGNNDIFAGVSHHPPPLGARPSLQSGYDSILRRWPRELTLNLSAYHLSAAIRNPVYPDARLSFTRALATRLQLAGFRKSRVLPRVDALSDTYPSQYAAVVFGAK